MRVIKNLFSTLRAAVCTLLVAVAVTLVAANVSTPVYAQAYGDGVYNGGLYSQGSSGNSSSSSSSGSSASSTPESTVVQTVSGLQVVINLADGQAIPSTGYYITITPINSDSKTFDKAEIYLDNTLAYSGAPDSTGTLKWFWDTNAHPATRVKIIVYGPGDTITTHEFSVTVTPVQASATQQTPQATPATTAGWPMWVIIGLGLLVLFILLLVLLLVRRRAKQDQPSPTSTPMS